MPPATYNFPSMTADAAPSSGDGLGAPLVHNPVAGSKMSTAEI
jgi:hypothetical protein